MRSAEMAAHAAAALVAIIAEAIESAGTDGIPSGYVYAAVMGAVNLQTYRAILDALIAAGEIRQTNHRLFWIGRPLPKRAGA